jgi:hypothetical protein
MTEENILALFARFRVHYPGTWKDFKGIDLDAQIEDWRQIFADLPAAAVFDAEKLTWRDNTSGFVPAPGVIRAKALTLCAKGKHNGRLSPPEAWSLLTDAARQGWSFPADCQRDFEALPPEIRKALGGCGEFYRLGNGNFSDTDYSVFQSRFYKNYELVLTELSDLDLLPETRRAEILIERGYVSANRSPLSALTDAAAARAELSPIADFMLALKHNET